MENTILWERIQHSDDDALKELFELHYKPLCSYALQFTGNTPDAEDLVQNEFVKLWTRRNNLNIHTSIKAYLYKSVYNSFMLKVREDKKKDKFFIALKQEALSHRIDEDNSHFHWKINKIKELLEHLPERCKEILLLSKREGYKNREIAEKLGVSIKTVESQIRIAFKKIREGFDEKNLLLFILSKLRHSKI